MKTLSELITTALRPKVKTYSVNGKDFVPNKAYELYLSQIALELMDISVREEITSEDLIKIAREIFKNIEH